MRAVAAGLLSLLVLSAAPASALVFASPDTEPATETPPDFPYWEHVTQRRYDGPTVIYLGEGHALTARHVGMGEIFLDGEIFEPERGTNRTILNTNGTAADAMVFELEDGSPLPDWPLVPIATEPPRDGEDVLLIGFGRGRARVDEFDDEHGSRFSFRWTAKGEKRWATNRITSTFEVLAQGNLTSRAFSMRFDEPYSQYSTRYEAQAAIGDSGGGVFVLRDGEWQLLGLMVSVSGVRNAPKSGAVYGDRTYVVDLSHYRPEIMRWTRASCSNEVDDDGDDRIDFPDDPGCDGPDDRNERDGTRFGDRSMWIAGGASLGILGVVLFAVTRMRRSGGPNSR
ncbi:MAG: serine protease [bacterium]|nr:serine protease [bacterium]